MIKDHISFFFHFSCFVKIKERSIPTSQPRGHDIQIPTEPNTGERIYASATRITRSVKVAKRK